MNVASHGLFAKPPYYSGHTVKYCRVTNKTRTHIRVFLPGVAAECTGQDTAKRRRRAVNFMVLSSRSGSCSLLLVRALQMEGELEFAPRDDTEVPIRSAARGSAGWHRDAEEPV